MEDTEASSSEEPGPPVNLQILSAENLSSDLKKDLQTFEEQQAKSREPNKGYLYLYVVDENGEPVANLHCFPYSVNWFIRNEYDVRIGLSRNSGLLPISAADVADADPAVLYLCNEDTETISYVEKPSITQEVEIDGERLEQLKAGGVLQVVWAKEKPIDTVTAVDYITVTVTDNNGQPAANRVVYIHMPTSQVGASPDRGDVWFMDVPYRPRYTDENGIARFVREDIFGSTPGGEREIVVLPCYGDFDASLKKAVHINVPSAPPWEFEITLD